MKTLVVISGKGGAGKTSLTAALASLAEKTVLADCDVDAADLHLVLNPTVHKEHSFVSGEYASIDPLLCLECGQCAEDCKYGAIRETAGGYEVVEHACEGCGMCEFVCPAKAISMIPRRCGAWYESTTRFGTMIHAALDIGGENSGKLVTTVRKAAEKAAEKEQAEIVLVDGPPGIGCPVIASLTGADTVILAAEAGMAAVHDLKRAVELLHHFKIPAVAVINKAGVNPAMETELREFCAANNIPVAGEIPYNTAITEAQLNNKAITEHDPDGLGRIFHDTWQNILQQLKNTDCSKSARC